MTGKKLEIVFFEAKNKETTCTFNGKHIHSNYNPQREAQNFVSSLKSDFTPSYIIITEPALSYSNKFLRQKFPGVKLCAVRFTDAFDDQNYLWDKVLYFKGEGFFQELFNAFGEETLLSAAIYSWPGSSLAFENINNECWKEIKKAVMLSRDIINTRNHFAKRWFLNTVNFLKYTKRICTIKKINKDILITASGPSLKTSIEQIKKNRNKFYLISVSSSLSVMLYNGIIPDMVLSTDGGWWAKKHLEFIKKYSALLQNTVFAITDEACCPKRILENFTVLPLIYSESTGEVLLKNNNINFIYASRNGTVSGTAALLALTLTDKNVYFTGLDLESSDAFQHTLPNQLESINSCTDFRLKTKENRLTLSRFNSDGSLRVYRDWFKNQKKTFTDRLLRLSDDWKYNNSLLPVKEADWNNIKISSEKGEAEISFSDNNTNPQKIKTTAEKILKDSQYNAELFPLEILLLKRAENESQKEECLKKIEAEQSKLLKKIERL